MNTLLSKYNSVSGSLALSAQDVLPTLARFVFGAVLLLYFWMSGLTKLGEGVFGFLKPSTGAYAQIFPKVMEAVVYDTSQLGWFHWAVVVGGTLAEFVLPLLIVIGLFTRLAALSMIGFIIVQSLTDLFGHGGFDHPDTLGAWFDHVADGAILDQRLLWVFPLCTLVMLGGGWLSVDRLFNRSSS